jgi:hypothetical protein
MSRFTPTAPTRRSFAASAAVLLAAASVAACAGYGPSGLAPGATEAEIVARLGPPTGRHRSEAGQERLEFARGPYGRHTYMLTLDAAGRLVQSEQVLTEARFAAVAPGAPASQVRADLGRPSQTRVGWRGVGEVWSYRYEATFCQWFQVWVVNGAVREAAYAPDPLCDVDPDDRHPF